MTFVAPPDPTEAAEYYFRYISQVPAGHICRILEDQLEETFRLLDQVSEERSLYRYAPGKWSMRQVMAHVNDTERLFAFRAFWFARGFESELPNFDQDWAMARTNPDARSLSSHLQELRVIRRSSLALFAALAPEAWDRRGMASGKPFSVRALAYLCAGHLTHHLKGLREHYLVPAGAESGSAFRARREES